MNHNVDLDDQSTTKRMLSWQIKISPKSCHVMIAQHVSLLVRLLALTVIKVGSAYVSMGVHTLTSNLVCSVDWRNGRLVTRTSTNAIALTNSVTTITEKSTTFHFRVDCTTEDNGNKNWRAETALTLIITPFLLAVLRYPCLFFLVGHFGFWKRNYSKGARLKFKRFTITHQSSFVIVFAFQILCSSGVLIRIWPAITGVKSFNSKRCWAYDLCYLSSL